MIVFIEVVLLISGMVLSVMPHPHKPKKKPDFSEIIKQFI